MPQQTPQQLIETQRQDWNRVAGGWEKWDRFFDEQMAFLNHRLVADARLRSGMRVLDLGSGTGYPALLAAQTVGPAGRVIGLDLARSMLEVARRKAAALGLPNVRFKEKDVSKLPFDTATIDAIISRFCLMFLPDVPAAAREIARVLAPGGRLAAAVWSVPEKNPYLRIPMDVIKQFIDLPSPDPITPGIFRLAKPGDLAGLLANAGLDDIHEEEFLSDVRFASGEEYFESLLDIAAPIQNLFAKLSDQPKAEARTRIIQAAEAYRRDRIVALPIAVRFVCGRKSP